MAYDAFTKFSEASSLVANLDKNSAQMAGAIDEEKTCIRSSLKMAKGSFPFKYLGAPLTTRKLSYSDCKPFVDKTVDRVRSWFAKHLSYAGRIQLVKSVCLASNYIGVKFL